MFTGIIQGQGEVLALRDSGTERRFTLRPLFSLPSIVDGESIAVNGACLSVETHGEGVFTAYASTETLSRTTLGRLSPSASDSSERDTTRFTRTYSRTAVWLMLRIRLGVMEIYERMVIPLLRCQDMSHDFFCQRDYTANQI